MACATPCWWPSGCIVCRRRATRRALLTALDRRYRSGLRSLRPPRHRHGHAAFAYLGPAIRVEADRDRRAEPGRRAGAARAGTRRRARPADGGDDDLLRDARLAQARRDRRPRDRREDRRSRSDRGADAGGAGEGEDYFTVMDEPRDPLRQGSGAASDRAGAPSRSPTPTGPRAPGRRPRIEPASSSASPGRTAAARPRCCG